MSFAERVSPPDFAMADGARCDMGALFQTASSREERRAGQGLLRSNSAATSLMTVWSYAGLPSAGASRGLRGQWPLRQGGLKTTHVLGFGGGGQPQLLLPKALGLLNSVQQLLLQLFVALVWRQVQPVETVKKGEQGSQHGAQVRALTATEIPYCDSTTMPAGHTPQQGPQRPCCVPGPQRG